MDAKLKKLLSQYFSANGAKGGAAGTGAVKARPSHVARRAAKIGQAMRHLKPGYRLCEKCGGSGHNDFYMDHECGYCGGTGQVVTQPDTQKHVRTNCNISQQNSM